MNERVKQLAVKLKMTPTDKTRIEYCAVGGERKWWLLGCVEGDQALPGTAGARTVAEAVEGAENWLEEQ